MIPFILTGTTFALAYMSFVLHRITSYFGWSALATGLATLSLLLGPHPAAGIAFAAIAIILTWVWWNMWRDKRRRAARWLGEKSRAALAKLARRMRESGTRTRRRVPVPVPC